MPSPNLNAKIVINSASPNDLTNTSWDVSFSVNDLEGNFDGSNIQINDVLFLDTSTEFPGTITRYKITSVSAQNFTDVSCTIIFDDDNSSKPDLGYVIGIDGIALRPSQFDYNLISDPSSQLVSNKFAIFPLNNNWKNIADFVRAEGSYSQNKSLISEIDEKISSSQIDNLVYVTQQQYDSIAEKNSRTIYIVEESAVNLAIAQGENSVSGYGVTFSGSSGSSISFEKTFIINTYIDIIEIKIYISNVYCYRITTFNDVINSNNSFTIATANDVYTSSFGSGNNLGSYIRIDF